MSIITQYKDLLVEALKEHKKLIIGAYILFIVVFIIAWMFASSNIEGINNAIATANATANATSTPIGFTGNVLGIFIQNAGSGILIYLTSILFGIPAILMLFYNAINIGALGPILGSMLPGGGIRYIIYLIPHGIFEFTAIVLQSVAGILFFLFIYKSIRTFIGKETNGFKEAFEANKKIFIHSAVILILVIILFIIAAPIEAFVSFPLSGLILGL